MKIWITGIAGVLGSNLAKRLKERGFDVSGNDIAKPNETWRLRGTDIKWLWKATEDLSLDDIKGYDVIFDAGLSVPDRPFGTSSPKFTLINNLLPPVSVLELIKNSKNKIWAIYPSSFNALYGWIFKGVDTFHEKLTTFPTSPYGWSKGAAETLYLTYHFTYNIPVSIIRTGSTFGEGGRLDELPHKLISYGLLNKEKFIMKSPHAKRLWGYIGDVLEFYDKLFDRGAPEEYEILHLAGNKGDETLENVDLAKRVFNIIKADTDIVEAEYEVGEEYKGKLIDFKNNAEETRSKISWSPRYSINEGLKNTIEWFKNNEWYYKALKD